MGGENIVGGKPIVQTSGSWGGGGLVLWGFWGEKGGRC